MWPFTRKAAKPLEPVRKYGSAFACESLHLQDQWNGGVCQNCGQSVRVAVVRQELREFWPASLWHSFEFVRWSGHVPEAPQPPPDRFIREERPWAPPKKPSEAKE